MMTIEKSISDDLASRLSASLPSWTIRLRDWADINSGSGNASGLVRMAGVLADAFAELGLPVETLHIGANGPALQVRCRPEAPRQVLLNGHYDTVYGLNHAFQCCGPIKDGRLNGPGVTDMKGGLLVMLEALRAFEQTPDREQLGWEVLITPDEETGSLLSAELLRHVARRHDYGLVFESSPVDGTLARRRPAVGAFTATIQGRPAHAGRDFAAGRNAIARLARVVTAVHAWNGELPGVIANVAAIHADGPLNVVPALARAELGVRAFSAAGVAAVRSRMAALAETVSEEDGYTLSWTGNFTRPPKEIDAGTEALFLRVLECGKQLGLRLGWRDTGGASDGNILQAAGLPVLDNLGVRGGAIHSEDEFVVLDSLPERVALTVLLLRRLADEAAGRSNL